MAKSKGPKRVISPWGSVPGSMRAGYAVIDTEQRSKHILSSKYS